MTGGLSVWMEALLSLRVHLKEVIVTLQYSVLRRIMSCSNTVRQIQEDKNVP
jgi:hypothetical protein